MTIPAKLGKDFFCWLKKNKNLILYWWLISGFRGEIHVYHWKVQANRLSKGYIPLMFSMNVDAMTAMFPLKSFISSLTEGKRGHITMKTCINIKRSQGLQEESTSYYNLDSLLLLAQSETELPQAFKVFWKCCKIFFPPSGLENQFIGGKLTEWYLYPLSGASQLILFYPHLSNAWRVLYSRILTCYSLLVCMKSLLSEVQPMTGLTAAFVLVLRN